MRREGWRSKLIVPYYSCCSCVACLVSPSHSNTSVGHAGLLPLIVAFLNEYYSEAVTACTILRHICRVDVDPCNIHADLLARLQAVRRLSFILEHVQASKGTMEAAGTVRAVSLSCSH